MNPAAIVTLLQLVASLLTGTQVNAQTIAVASRAIQLSAQAIATPKMSFSVPQNNDAWPNITDLYNSAYLDENGNYVPQNGGTGVALLAQYTSFGDLNNDGFDDAAVIVQRTDATGSATFALAAMLNQGGVMFNIADLPIGPAATMQINSHNIVSGGDIVLNMQNGTNGVAQTSTYELLGDQLIKL